MPVAAGGVVLVDALGDGLAACWERRSPPGLEGLGAAQTLLAQPRWRWSDWPCCWPAAASTGSAELPPPAWAGIAVVATLRSRSRLGLDNLARRAGDHRPALRPGAGGSEGPEACVSQRFCQSSWRAEAAPPAGDFGLAPDAARHCHWRITSAPLPSRHLSTVLSIPSVRPAPRWPEAWGPAEQVVRAGRDAKPANNRTDCGVGGTLLADKRICSGSESPQIEEIRPSSQSQRRVRANLRGNPSKELFSARTFCCSQINI